MNRFRGKYNKVSSLKIIFSLFLVAILVLGFQNFTNKYEFNEMLSTMRSPWYLVMIFVLVFFNLFAESKKWTALINSEIGSLRAVKAVLAGYSTATLSPNRIAEFAGRTALFPKEIRPELTTATFVGSFIQGSLTVGFGIVSVLIIPFHTDIFRHFDFVAFFWILSFVFISFIGVYFFRAKLFDMLSEYITALRNVSFNQVIKAAFWAFLRYVIFLFQFYLALMLFGYEGGFLFAACGISFMYMIQSYIPLSSLGELGVREFLCFVIFTSSMNAPVAAVFPALIIWFINIAMPALTGLVMLKTQWSLAR